MTPARGVLATVFALLALLALGAATASAGGLVAPRGACPEPTTGGGAATREAEEGAMLCLTNYARAGVGEAPLEDTSQLQESATDKAADILSCDSFSHTACGREFTYWIRATGYLQTQCWRAGENLAWGTGAFGTVRSIFRAWMRSPEHRANILGEYSQIGIDRDSGTLEGHAGTVVWTQHFGSHC
jgi:serralysin